MTLPELTLLGTLPEKASPKPRARSPRNLIIFFSSIQKSLTLGTNKLVYPYNQFIELIESSRLNRIEISKLQLLCLGCCCIFQPQRAVVQQSSSSQVSVTKKGSGDGGKEVEIALSLYVSTTVMYSTSHRCNLTEMMTKKRKGNKTLLPYCNGQC